MSISAPPPTTATTSSSARFQYPSIHSFPPFYTLQPNLTSRAQQLQQWRSLILSFCQHHRIFYIDLSPSARGIAGTATATAPGVVVDAEGEERDVWRSLFRNGRIGRALDTETAREVLQEMVKKREAAWDGVPATAAGKAAKTAQASRVLVYWRSPAAWGDLIYDWVTATGQNKSIMTLFELTQGDLVEGQDFYDLPIPLLRQALQHLSQQGKAQIFAGTESEDGEGVKFL